MLKDLIETDNFKVTVIDDVDTVEVCGALKVILGHFEDETRKYFVIKIARCIYRIL